MDLLGDSVEEQRATVVRIDPASKFGGIVKRMRPFECRYVEICPGRRGRDRVFRIAGQWVEKFTGRSHVDLFKIGRL